MHNSQQDTLTYLKRLVDLATAGEGAEHRAALRRVVVSTVAQVTQFIGRQVEEQDQLEALMERNEQNLGTINRAIIATKLSEETAETATNLERLYAGGDEISRTGEHLEALKSVMQVSLENLVLVRNLGNEAVAMIDRGDSLWEVGRHLWRMKKPFQVLETPLDEVMRDLGVDAPQPSTLH